MVHRSPSSRSPTADDYLRLFERWHALLREDVGPEAGRDFGDAYKATEDERFRLLFEQICQLLIAPSPFNQAMPQAFRRTAQQWVDGDPATLAHMGDVQNRHFMLSDLYDYVHLSRAMGVGWRG
ncbi:hypothetical protein [Methyloversatilis thermotolerans]|uniref:hypothetical protein n=1 Tax=Methyloversatilis thermotolerans TaxID=1346290 RepID=UPI00037EA924|nr:hypothetical protein [Methyloversatilis thermotolerans]